MMDAISVTIRKLRIKRSLFFLHFPKTKSKSRLENPARIRIIQFIRLSHTRILEAKVMYSRYITDGGLYF